MNKILIHYIVIFIILISGCNNKNENLVFAYQDRIVDTLSIVAVKKEFLMSNIDSKMFSSGSQTIESLISGSADIASMGDSAAILLLSKYSGFVIIASQGSGSERHRIIVSEDINVETWDDLKDKKIGIKKGTSTHGGLILKMKEMGLSNLENLIDMQPSLQLTALASKEIDVMIASEPTPSLAESKNLGSFFSSLQVEDISYPVVLVTTKDVLENRLAELNSLLISLKMAEKFVKEHEDSAIDILSELNGFETVMVKKSLALHNLKILKPSDIKESMLALSEVLLRMNKIVKQPAWDNMLDNRLFK